MSGPPVLFTRSHEQQHRALAVKSSRGPHTSLRPDQTNDGIPPDSDPRRTSCSSHRPVTQARKGPRPHAVRQTDVVPPTKPTHLAKPRATKTSVSLIWTAGTDNLGVAGYTVYLGGTKVATTTSTRYTVSKLKCGKSYTLAIDAYDAARNHSARARVTTWTSRCWVPSLATLTRLTTTAYSSATSFVRGELRSGLPAAGHAGVRRGRR